MIWILFTEGNSEAQKEAKEILQMIWKVAPQVIDINIFDQSICVKWGWDHFTSSSPVSWSLRKMRNN